ncbi:MAG: phosphatidate cytidylyltransferase [Holosporales bacterium]|jgi:phosphatidate cytidylyltransferase|nr:phosphatidate cytidylyltransferase [Holosporales bacterium]
MVGETAKRTVSALCIISIIITAFLLGRFWTRLLVAALLILILYEWISINIKTSSKYNIIERSLVLFGGIAYAVVPMLYWVQIANENYFHCDILWCALVTTTCDLFAYFGGRLMGGPKFVPNISKNKTWSGAVTGFAFGTAVSYVFLSHSHVFHINSNALLYSVIMALASIMGDLIESKAKRYLGVKDSGSIIPGHGGICDRLDSFLLTSYVVMALRILGF